MKDISITSLLRSNWRILFVGLLLVLASRMLSMALPLSSKYLIDEVLLGGHRENLSLLIWLVLGASIVQGLLSRSARRLISGTAQEIIADTRQKLHEHVLKFHTSYFDSNKSGNLVKRILDDVYDIRDLVGTGLLSLFGAILTSIFAMGLMLSLNVKLTFVTLAGISLFAGVLSFYMKKAVPIHLKDKELKAAVSGRLTESMAGIRVIKSYRAEQEEEKAFQKGTNDLRDASLSIINSYSNLTFAINLGLGLLGAGIMYVGASEITAGSLTVGGLFSYLLLLGFMIEPVMQLVAFGEFIGSSYAALERVRELFQEKTEYEDVNRTISLNSINGRIEFRDVSFAYDSRPVLKEVSFTAEPGTITAFVGPSGSGKSTIIGLLALLYSPKEGSIFIDGTDLSKVLIESYRSSIGLVAQDTFLFDGTIRENILYARPNSPENELTNACRLARVDEFAERLENKYETIVGERGIKLSGGQKQRISIARAILANPKILLLDEATSSLDTESEQYVQEALSELMKDRTTFVVAHRLSTIKNADQIFVVEAGEIAEYGTHESLMNQNGRFADMWNQQVSLRESGVN